MTKFGSLRTLQKIWRSLPIPQRARRFLAPLSKRTFGHVVHRAEMSQSADLPRFWERAPQSGPLVLAGFTEAAHGIGVWGRLIAAELRKAGFAPAEFNIEPAIKAPAFEPVSPPPGEGGVLITVCNPPEYAIAVSHYGVEAVADKYRVGVWAYEEEIIPDDWAAFIDHFHEIWAPSQFVAQAIRASAPGRCPPIHVMPIPSFPEGASPKREEFGIPLDAVAVLVAFDLKSTMARKNPYAALKAYMLAFPEPQESMVLVLKLNGSQLHAAEAADLRQRIAGRSDIICIDEVLSDEGAYSLIESCDIILSLHRSEGYGLVLSQAMHLGKVVIATGWSGNMDFMDEASAVPVPYRLVPVQDPSRRYGLPGSRWADPDVEQAAQSLRKYAVNRDLRRTVGRAAQPRISAHENQFQRALQSMNWPIIR